MMNLKPLISTATAILAIHCSAVATAADDLWTTDFAAAKKEAAAGDKSLLINFSGSDWCGYCIALDKEVFDHDEFQTWLKKKFVPVMLDFPRDSSKMSEETVKQNQELQETYILEGRFPTILLTDPEGKPFASTGYRPGGPEKYTAHLKKLLATQVARDKDFKKAADATGVEKAKALFAGLDAMQLSDKLLAKFYAPEIAAIRESDPNDESGYVKAQEAKARYAAFENEVGALEQKNDLAAAEALVDKTLKEGGFSSDDTQQVMRARAIIFAEQGKFDQALKALDEMKKFAPDSDVADGADSLKEQIEKARSGAEPKTKKENDGLD